MNERGVMLGQLSCRVFDRLPAERDPRWIVILCHGFGAPGADLVPLAPEVLSLNPRLSEQVRFIFPEALLSLDQFGLFGGRAWWHLDMARLTRAIELGEFRDLREEIPAGLADAREALLSLLAAVTEQTGLPLSRIVLAGFSQGAMLATDVALHLPQTPAALCIFSGTLLCESLWRKLAESHRPQQERSVDFNPREQADRWTMPVLQSHGRQDPILPYEAAEWLRDFLTEAGLPVDFIPFDGGHTIPLEALVRFTSLLERLAEQEQGPAPI